MENTIDTIYDRRSVRKYLDKPVNPDLVDEILRAGMFAPLCICTCYSACMHYGMR